MNLFGCWTAVVLAVLTTVASILGGVLPQKTFHHHQHHLLQQQPQQQQDQFPSAHQTHHVGIDMERWSNAVDASNFPLQDTDSDGASTDNDRSVYDPGVVDSEIPSPAQSSAFIDALSESLLAANDQSAPYNTARNSPTASKSGSTRDDTSANDDAILDDNEMLLSRLHADIKADEDFAVKSAVLLKMLESSAAGAQMPIVYVEDEDTDAAGPDNEGVSNGDDALPEKRSGRYYRRYPWKRQQSSRYRTYESEQRYMCVPSRDEVFKLLVGLHDNRKGNQNRTVNFCNRKRPAKAIFTNLRFLG